MMQLWLLFWEEGARSSLDPDFRLSVDDPNFPPNDFNPTPFLQRHRATQERHQMMNSSPRQHDHRNVRRHVDPQDSGPAERAITQEGNHTRLRAVRVSAGPTTACQGSEGSSRERHEKAHQQ